MGGNSQRKEADGKFNFMMIFQFVRQYIC